MRSAIAKTIFLLMVWGVTYSCRKQTTSDAATAVSIPSHPLNSAQDLDVLIQQIGDARIVLLGESSHGTAEYYEWRAALSKRLIQEKGFDFIGVEGEWADSYRVNNFVKGPKQDSTAAETLLRHYDRWPTWMWGNYEIASLVTWMNAYNQNRPSREKVGFYGLDVYCLWESMTELMPYLQGTTSDLKSAAQAVHTCFQPYSSDPSEYSYAVANASSTCRSQTERLWSSIQQLTDNATAKTEAEFVMQQNALVALNGERYYRASVSSYTESWNIRDRHMMQTINRLLDFHGADSKIIIWEHNTHVGDARYTDMAAEGTVNVGQLVREQYGEKNVFAVGFGSYSGSVIASNTWGGPILRMEAPAAPRDSWEGLLHAQGATNKIILSSELRDNAALQKSIGHRAIGVVYNPAREQGNYVPSIIPKRYDAFVYIDQTTALHPINTPVKREPPDTYPSGY
jgi:erythromycin esterase